jgi:hypothetical protein
MDQLTIDILNHNCVRGFCFEILKHVLKEGEKK